MPVVHHAAPAQPHRGRGGRGRGRRGGRGNVVRGGVGRGRVRDGRVERPARQRVANNRSGLNSKLNSLERIQNFISIFPLTENHQD